MRRVLVPLDGSELAEVVLPDARRLAGPEGEVMLVRDASIAPRYQERFNAEASLEYLKEMANDLRAQGVSVETQMLAMGDAALGVDEAATILEADMIAIATHGRNLAQRLLRGGVAWQALAHSSVPVLLRHVQESEGTVWALELEQRHILVPLDGSQLSEEALPLAAQLAGEWQASILLAQVVPKRMATCLESPAVPRDNNGDVLAARAYLDHIGENLRIPVEVSVLTGSTLDTLVAAVHEQSITDVVMASHGRTGLSRVILGSVADGLIQRLRCPIIVIPMSSGLAPANRC